MSDLTPDQIDHLHAAHRTFDRPDGVARARLLAAVAAEGPPPVRTPWQVRLKTMKTIGTRISLAATLLLALAGIWYATQPRNAFAQVARAMAQAEGYQCNMTQIVPHEDGTAEPVDHGRLYWTAAGADRHEMTTISTVVIHRPNSTGLELHTDKKQYRILPRVLVSPFSYGLFSRLNDYNGATARPVGTLVIDGRPTEEFVVPLARVIDDEGHGETQVRMWLDPATKLPARVDMVDSGGKRGRTFRLEHFRWGPQDPKLFDTAVPDGYSQIPVIEPGADQITEYVAFGLKTFARYDNGRYPAVKYVYGDEQQEALRTRMGIDPKESGGMKPNPGEPWDRTKTEEFGHASYGLTWINILQREHPDFAYQGRTVTSRDAGKVLLRWQLDDGTYRVLFGDLRAETVDAGRLKELEAQ